MRQAFVIAEIACSLVLLAGVGLLVRSLQALRNVPLGFSADHRVVVLVSLPRMRYQNDLDVVRFFRQVGEKVRSLPGVSDATVMYPVPLQDAHWGFSFKLLDGQNSDEQYNPADIRLVDSHTFATLGMPLLRGRTITDSDYFNSELVCVINRTMAERYWPKQDPLGRLILISRNDVNGTKLPWRIVGITGDIRERINEEAQPTVYVPYAQMSFFNMEVVVHSRATVAEVRKSVASVLQSVDPDQPVRAVNLLSDYLPAALSDWTIAITLLGGLAGMALILTTIGVFAVISYMVREKTREIGIRMAVGATPRRIRGLVLAQTGWLAAIGTAIGLAVSASCTRFLGSLIYGVGSTDPVTFAVVSAMVAAVALLASLIPARRAMSVDPMLALRHE